MLLFIIWLFWFVLAAGTKWKINKKAAEFEFCYVSARISSSESFLSEIFVIDAHFKQNKQSSL